MPCRLSRGPREQRAQLDPARDPELGVDAVEVGLDGAAGQRQPAAISRSVRPRAAKPATSRSRLVRPSPPWLRSSSVVAPSHRSTSCCARVRSRAAAVRWPRPAATVAAAAVSSAACSMQPSSSKRPRPPPAARRRARPAPRWRRAAPAAAAPRSRAPRRASPRPRRRAVAGGLVQGEHRVGDVARRRAPAGPRRARPTGVGHVACRRLHRRRQEVVLHGVHAAGRQRARHVRPPGERPGVADVVDGAGAGHGVALQRHGRFQEVLLGRAEARPATGRPGRAAVRRRRAAARHPAR